MKNDNKPIFATITKGGALYIMAVELYHALEIDEWYSDWLQQLEVDYFLDPDYELYTDEEGIEWLRASFAKALCSTLNTVASRRVREYIRTIMDCPDSELAAALASARYRCDAQAMEIDILKRNLENLRVKADYFDQLVEAKLYTDIDVTAQELGIPLDAFCGLLLRYHYVRKRKSGELRATRLAVDEGLFLDDRQRITPKGRETFRLLSSVLI